MAADIAVPNGNPGKPRKAVPKSAQKSSVDPNVLEVVFGSLLIKPWYPSFYPEELVGRRVERLYVCHWCFKYNKEIVKFLGHMKVCALKNAPPGSLVYSKDGYSLYEIDGEESKLYAQSLSLFAKLFLDTKSVFYDVTTFLYYLLVAHEPNPAIPEMDFGSSTAQSSNITTGEAGDGGSAAGTEMVPGQVVGFFSKEKMSWDNNNLACILVFPPWQKHGLGQFLMAASYELGKREGRLGGPEKPLSELGRLGYMRYWSSTLARTILSHPARKTLTIADLRDETYITPEDIIMTLQAMDVLEHKKRGGADAVINKAKVREWVANHKVNLESRVDPEAFVVRNESEGSESE